VIATIILLCFPALVNANMFDVAIECSFIFLNFARLDSGLAVVNKWDESGFNVTLKVALSKNDRIGMYLYDESISTNDWHVFSILLYC
jgi:hypothetical protein